MTATKGLGTYGNGVGTVTPLDHKMAQLGLVVKTGQNTIRPGLFWDGNSTVVTGKANMTYDVRPFTAVTSRGATAGAVLLANDAVYNVTTTAAPGSNSRIDIIYVWQREFSIDGTNSDPVIGVASGTAAASPTAPSLAAFPGAIELARATIGAGITATTSATITQTAPFTAPAGGVVVVRNSTERAGTSPYAPAAWVTGQRVYQVDTSVEYRYDGTTLKGWESDWISYTPVFTAITEGAGGAKSGRYKYAGGRVFVEGSWTFGTSGSAIGANPRVDHPVTADATSGAVGYPLGRMTALDAGTAYYEGRVIAESTTAAWFFAENTSATYALSPALSGTAPFTFGPGDKIFWKYDYTAA